MSTSRQAARFGRDTRGQQLPSSSISVARAVHGARLALSSDHVRAADLRKLWIFVVEQRQFGTGSLWSLPQCRLRARKHARRSQRQRPSLLCSLRRGSRERQGRCRSILGATVLVVIGFVVVLAVAGVIWLRRNKAPSESGYRLTVGAMTRWSCGHEATLSHPLDPGVTVATAPCPFCGRPGIVGQFMAGQYVEVCS